MELDAQYAIAYVDQRSAGVLEHHAMRALAIAQREDAGPRLDGLIGVGPEIKIFRHGAAAWLGRTVKRDDAAGESVLDVRRQRAMIHLQTRDHFQKTDSIPEFEWAQFVAVAPAHGAINFNDAIRNLGNHLRAIAEKVAKDFPKKTPGAVVGTEQRANALAEIFDVARRFHRRKARLLKRLVLEGFPIEHQDLAGVSLARFLVKTLARLVAEPFLLDHFLLEIQRQKSLAPGIVRNKLVKIGSDEAPDVEAN